MWTSFVDVPEGREEESKGGKEKEAIPVGRCRRCSVRQPVEQSMMFMYRWSGSKSGEGAE